MLNSLLFARKRILRLILINLWSGSLGFDSANPEGICQFPHRFSACSFTVERFRSLSVPLPFLIPSKLMKATSSLWPIRICLPVYSIQVLKTNSKIILKNAWLHFRQCTNNHILSWNIFQRIPEEKRLR
jgi:hypothetical protein